MICRCRDSTKGRTVSPREDSWSWGSDSIVKYSWQARHPERKMLLTGSTSEAGAGRDWLAGSYIWFDFYYFSQKRRLEIRVFWRQKERNQADKNTLSAPACRASELAKASQKRLKSFTAASTSLKQVTKYSRPRQTQLKRSKERLREITSAKCTWAVSWNEAHYKSFHFFLLIALFIPLFIALFIILFIALFIILAIS